jgi:rod shape-determining protein MreB
MIDRLFSRFSKDIAIDLGTANTLIYASGQGVILDEPSVVVLKNEGGFRSKRSVVAVGNEAKSMIGRVPVGLEAIRPMKDGVIADFTVTELMIKYFIKKVYKNSILRASPRIVICVPCGSTQVERRAIRESALGAGASHVFLLEEPLAAAIGAGIDITQAVGSMIVDIGGGTTEIGVISLGGMVYKAGVRVGGDRFDEAIVTYVRRNFGILIGEQTAEQLKIKVAMVYPGLELMEMQVNGRNLNQGIPQSFTISSMEIMEALTDPVNELVSAIKLALENTPPELGSDISDRGVMLTGGGAMLRGLDRLIQEETGLPVMIAEDPLECVAKGCGMVLDNLDTTINIFTND